MMACNHTLGILAANNNHRRTDPTNTMVLRAKFVDQMRQRFHKLSADMKTSIIDNDAFGIVPRDDFTSHIMPTILQPLPPKIYEFLRTPEKVDEFMGWLAAQEKAGILETELRPTARFGAGVAEVAWSNKFIQTAYQKGIRAGRQKLKNAGKTITVDQLSPGAINTAFNQPFHADRVGLLYSRTFDNLKTVTSVMDTEIRRKLADGLSSGLARGIAEGKNPKAIGRELFKSLNSSVEHVGLYRATLIARTEVIRAHHVANIAEFRQAGVEGVEVEVEWMTAGFGVCPICADFAGDAFTLDQIEPMIPRHPQCRCTVLPIIGEMPEKPRPEVRLELPPTSMIPDDIIPTIIERTKLDVAVLAVPAPGLLFGDLERIGPRAGSNPGGLFKHRQTGEKWYVKTPKTEALARNELLAAKLYEAAGVEGPQLQLIDVEGSVGVASRWVEGLLKGREELLSGIVSGIGDGFAVDAWLANWDVVGLEYDNLLVSGSRAIRVDVGGSLFYRAQGTAKGTAWGKDVREFESLLDPGLNRQSADIFREIPEADMLRGVKKVLGVSDKVIKGLVLEFGPLDPKERKLMESTLIARKKYIKGKFTPVAKETRELPQLPGVIITDSEFAMVKNARGNGMTVAIDAEDIEDQSILVWNEKTGGGNTEFSGVFKLRRNTMNRIRQTLRGGKRELKEDEKVYINKLEIITSGINSLVEMILSVPPDKVAAKVKKAVEPIVFSIQDLKRMPLVSSGEYGNQVAVHLRILDEFVEAASTTLRDPRKGAQAILDHSASYKIEPLRIPERLSSKIGVEFEMQARADLNKSRIKNGHIKRTTKPMSLAHFRGWVHQGDGFKVEVWDGTDRMFALDGQVKITADSAAAFNHSRVVLEKLGISTARPTNLDREEMYLQQIFWHRKESAEGMFQNLGQEARVQRLRETLSQELGVEDISRLPDYKPRGVEGPFGDGRTMFMRPDLFGEEWDGFAGKYRLMHDVGNKDLEKVVDAVLDAGGKLLSTTERVRRGINVSGMSSKMDLETGGGSYVFTRIKQVKATERRPGFVFGVEHLKRLDGVSYGGDMYGRVDNSEFIIKNRISGVEGWAGMASNPQNESFFKNELSIFSVESINVSSEYMRERIIGIFEKHGAAIFPDGRKVEDVVKVMK